MRKKIYSILIGMGMCFWVSGQNDWDTTTAGKITYAEGTVEIGTSGNETLFSDDGNFLLRGPKGVLIKSGVFGSLSDVSNSYNKWIKLGQINLNGNWSDANLTLDFYPWNANHGDSRQQINISIRNSNSGIENSYDINLNTFYGKDLTIKDVKLVHTSGSGVSNNLISIWVQMGESHCYDIPFTAYYDGNVSLYFTKQNHHPSITESGTIYDLNSTFGMYGSQFGIGTSSPQSTLDVRGSLVIDEGKNATLFTGTGGSELNRYLSLINSPGYTSASGIKAGGVLVSDSYNYANPGKNDIIVKGKMGIGTTTPTHKLEVNGTIRSKEVKVEASPWPDYVFEPDYNLLSLEEIEAFIKSEKHLPEIPSAKDMEANGVQLGDMNMLLLKKVEELTLHVIELKKENDRQQKEIESLKKQ